jgi:hypothetical protein
MGIGDWVKIRIKKITIEKKAKNILNKVNQSKIDIIIEQKNIDENALNSHRIENKK